MLSAVRVQEFRKQVVVHVLSEAWVRFVSR